MSRHRFVRNLDLDEERDDGALSDGGDDLTPEQFAQLEAGLDAIRAVIGPEEPSGFTDSYIRDSLCDCNFDIEETLEVLAEVQERKNAARERKEAGVILPDDELLAQGMTPAQIHAARMAQLAEARSATGFGTAFPNDHLQSIQPFEEEYCESDPDVYVRRLSTITERTEKTEYTELPARSARSPSVAFSNRRSTRAPSSVTDSSYGEVIERRHGRNLPIDPNTIRPSPPPSALQLSHDGSDVHGSGDEDSTRTVTPPPRRPSAPVPPADLSDHPSRSTRASSSKLHPVIPVNVFKTSPKGILSPVDKPLPDLPPPSEPRHSVAESQLSDHPWKSKSKLSALASSRATTVSQSSRLSSSTLATSSVRTYPALRPSSQSELSLIEEESGSATSSIIRQAIRTAMNQEIADRSAVSPLRQHREVQYDSTVPSSSSSKSTAKPTSEAKDGSPTTFHTVVESPTTSSSERPTSKLAKLAQAKSKQGGSGASQPRAAGSPAPPSLLPTTHTEYLTPIANGPTATTAITTSYQSLSSLLSPTRSALPPSFLPAGHNSSSPSSPEPRQSKLAIKAKKSHLKQGSSTDGDQAYLPVPVHAMFKPEGNRSHKGHRKERRDKLPRERRRSHGRSNPTSPLDEATANVKASSKHKSSAGKATNTPLAPLGPFAFDIPSPDDIILNARRGTSLGRSVSDTSTFSALPASTAHTRSSFTSAAKEREKAQKLAAQKKMAEAQAQAASRAANRAISPTQKSPKATKSPKKAGGTSTTGTATPKRKGSDSTALEQQNIDVSALGLGVEEKSPIQEEPPRMALARERALEEAAKALEAESKGQAGVSLVVIGHVDAGKSTLMGRLLYDCGRVDDKSKVANERASNKIGKGSFSWAWQFDGTTEERERGITMDIAVQTLSTPHRNITILDAPGHRDFIPNMISGASQADCALLVVDASTGEFEAGFDRGGQTREHVVLVRSLGVTQIVAAINKLDMVDWSKDRYGDICNQLKTFFVQSGFQASKTHFVPVGAMSGVNLVNREGQDAVALNAWYSGPTLVELLDRLRPPRRDIASPLRFPISNVFKGQGSTTGVWGRVCSGLVQVGERLRVLPGDETAVVKAIETDTEMDRIQWAAAGSNVTLYLTAIDPIHLDVGRVLCPPTDPIPLASAFAARIIVFDIQVPILAGTSIELFHHSRDVPAAISKLNATLDRASGAVTKQNPRVLTKGTSAEVHIAIRQASFGGSGGRSTVIPLEPFSTNKEMGRILIRRGGETIAAGIVLGIIR